MQQLVRERYEVLAELGVGAEAQVLKARDTQLDRTVALKVRQVSDGFTRAEILAEAKTLLAIPPHAHLPLVREDFFDGERYVIVMDWVDGTDLADLRTAHGRPGLPPSLVLQWLAQAAAALSHLHALDPPVFHADVKPANLLLTQGGSIVLVDFGLAASGLGGLRGGTSGYMAPELQAGGDPSRASDIYALAATAWSLLAGAPPPDEPGPWPAGPVVRQAIEAGLDPDPANRPRSVGELVERMRAGWGATLPTGVLTFLATTVHGAAERWAADPTAMARDVAAADQHVARLVEEHGGRFLAARDGEKTLSVFGGAVPAVTTAVAIQRAHPEGDRLPMGIALHTGEAEVGGDDYVGAALGTTSWLRGCARPGEVLVSDATAALVAVPDAPWRLVDLGPHLYAGRRQHVHAVAAEGTSAPPDALEPPYPGLLPFSGRDRERFHGREDTVAGLLQRLAPGRPLALVGSSGSGKSSVLRAGIAPALPGAVVVTPAQLLAQRPAPRALLVDQFEELFTLVTDPARRAVIVDALLRHPDVLVLAMRADFYGRCSEHPALAAAVAANHVLLGPMDAAQLRRAIVGPAATLGVSVEPGLVDVLIKEVSGEPGALPLLSHALRATWELRTDRTLTMAAYEQTGGVRGAIAATADKLLATLAAEDVGLVRSVLLRLVNPGDGAADTRRRVARGALRPAGVSEQRLDGVVERMAQARLLTLDADTVEVAHEALIREWPQLRLWLDEDREGLRLHRHLADAAQGWEAAGRDEAELYRGARLGAAVDWAGANPNELTEQERAFLAAAQELADAEQAALARRVQEQARTNRWLRGALVAAGVLVVVAAVTGFYALIQRDRANEQAEVAANQAEVAGASALAADARRAGAQALASASIDETLLLAVAGRRLEDSAVTHANLLAAVTRGGSAVAARRLPQGVYDVLGLAAGPDGSLYVGRFDEALLAYGPGGDQLPWDREKRGEDALAVSADGSVLAADITDATGTYLVRLTDTASGERLGPPLSEPSGRGGDITGIALNADGTRVAAAYGPKEVEDGAALVVVWEDGQAEPAWVVAPEGRGRGAFGEAPSLAFTPDGERLVVVGDGEGVVLDATTGAERQRIPGVYAPAALSPDGRRLASATRPPGAVSATGATGRVSGNDAVVVDLTGALPRRTLSAHTEVIAAVAFAPDGHSVATGGEDGRVIVWDVASGAPVRVLEGHAGRVLGVTFTPDGLLHSASIDGTLLTWQPEGSNAVLRSLPAGPPLAGPPLAGPHDAVIVDANGTVALHLLTEGRVQLRDTGDGSVEPPLETGHGEISAAALAPDGRQFVTAGPEGTVRLWARGRPDPVAEYDHGADVRALAIASGTGSVVFFDVGGRGGVLAAETLELVRELNVGGSPFNVNVTADGDTAAVTLSRRVPLHPMVVLDLATGSAVASVDLPSVGSSAAFSPEAAVLAVGTVTGEVLMVDLRQQAMMGAPLDGHSEAVVSLAFSPDGAMLASGGRDGAFVLWDVTARQRVGRVIPGTPNLPVGVAFAPDGHTLIAAGRDRGAFALDTRPDSWEAHACQVAGRDLTEEQWAELFPGRPWQPTCPQPS